MTKRTLTLHGRGMHWLRMVVAAGVAVAMIGVSAAEAATSAAIVVDAKNGKILYSSNPDARCFPASLTKMMTLYLLFEALSTGKTTLTSKIKISAHAAAQPPSKLGLKPGSTITVKDAILALVTRSANDIAAAIGEHLAGSELAFATKMTAKARALGMSKTTFRNASGLPDPAQVTTARDMARLGRALQDRFPQYFAYFKTPSFTYQGRKIANHNRLLGRVAGVNGIKTGYTRASGYNLVTSVDRDGKKLVAVVMGGKSGASRDERMASLVSDYIPKATSGPRSASLILPDGASVDTDVAAAESPLPRAKPDTETDSMSVASLAAEDERSQGDIGDDDAATTPPPVAATGWKIQLAATPTEATARALLESAMDKAPKVLAKASPFTERVVKNSVTLYRARFAGFASKQAARDACDALTKQKFTCLALSN